MSSWVENAIRRIEEYQRQDVCFLTQFRSIAGVRLTIEKEQPLLRRPRVEIVCPVGTDVADVRAAFDMAFIPSLFPLWWEKNGEDLVKKGYLYE